VVAARLSRPLQRLIKKETAWEAGLPVPGTGLESAADPKALGRLEGVQRSGGLRKYHQGTRRGLRIARTGLQEFLGNRGGFEPGSLGAQPRSAFRTQVGMAGSGNHRHASLLALCHRRCH
jgi:hypothetical protein